MKSIKDSSVFIASNKFVDLLSQIAEFNDKCTLVNPEELSMQLAQMKMSSLPLCNEIIEAFISGKIKIGLDKGIQLPSSALYLPFPAKNNLGMVILINATDFMRYDDVKELYVIQPNILHNLLFGAYCTAAIMANETSFKNDHEFRIKTGDIMTKLFMNVIMRDTSLASADAADLLTFLYAKFLHCGLYELNPAASNEFATRLSGFNNIDKIAYLNMTYEDNLFCNLDGFISVLNKEFRQLQNYSIMDLIRGWTQYGQAANLALDYLPYTFALIMSAQNGFAIYRSDKLKKLVGKEAGLLSKQMVYKVKGFKL
jgi:hypothetical protein